MEPEGDATRTRLVAHVGFGKTGSTSIQQCLRSHAQALREQGTWYLGLMLEYADAQRFPWQRAGTSMHAMAKNRERSHTEAMEVLEATLDTAAAQGVRTLIWSNEAMLRRPDFVIPVLEALVERRAIELQVVAYVRRHDAWARSAYVQWGIKHKTYSGALQSFAQFTERTPPRFAAHLERWASAFPSQLVLRNYDAVADAAADFLGICGLDPQVLQPKRVYVTPAPEMIALRAMFNAEHKTQCSAARFDHAVGAEFTRARSLDDYLAGLMPSTGDLEAVKASSADDRAAVDALLTRYGQPPLEVDPISVQPSRVSTERMLGILCQLAMRQAGKIAELEARLAALAPAEAPRSAPHQPKPDAKKKAPAKGG